MKKTAVVALIAAAVWFHFSRPSVPSVESAPPEVALRAESETQAPLQHEPQPVAVFAVSGYELHTLQTFAIKARVLGVEHYRMGREAELSTTDIAFGWGRMASPGIFGQLSISQSGRWYHWRYNDVPPIPTREIEVSSANMHLIPGNAEVAGQLSKVGKGEIVSLRGYLVEARAKDGWRWRSSLTREDTGAGACELVFVQAIELHR